MPKNRHFVNNEITFCEFFMIQRFLNKLRFKMLEIRGMTDLPVIPSSAAASSRRSLDERELYPHLFPNYKPDPIPEVTVGSIITWFLIKLGLLILILWFLFERFRLQEYWLVGLGVIWLVVVYPAFMQYQRFKAQTRILEANTLCAKCRHFDETGHFCTLLDEHVSLTYTPCGGESWEAKPRFSQDDDDETFS
jgi:hypothetical protein